ncbi:hypothetical protein QJS10_CPA01g00167 [Acorus calamus]|uniref:Protein SLOW GREEN 1, chloroplastic n=1 Tax=Acorus calamus TaxID=4465 RepID=A0AAV9FH80_ACOCL|nr:hypothetical protein QJS10_CPA01g00167 [Acorus calamus]
MDSLTRGALIHGERLVFPSFSPSNLNPKSAPALKHLRLSPSKAKAFRASSSSSPDKTPPFLPRIRTTAGAVVLTAATVLLASKLSRLPARAGPPPPPPTTEKTESPSPAVSHFLESNSEAIDALRSLLYKKLEEGEDDEVVKVLNKLVEARPKETEWKFLLSRLHNENGDTAEARRLLEEILTVDPLSFEGLFEIAVLMDQCGEGEAVMRRLEEALSLAKEEQKGKEARDVRFIMAQMKYLQKDVDGALESYSKLAREDPKDYRPYFCRGVIFSLLDRNKEAREEFKKYHERSAQKFDVDGFLQTPLSRTKLFGVGRN